MPDWVQRLRTWLQGQSGSRAVALRPDDVQHPDVRTNRGVLDPAALAQVPTQAAWQQSDWPVSTMTPWAANPAPPQDRSQLQTPGAAWQSMPVSASRPMARS